MRKLKLTLIASLIAFASLPAVGAEYTLRVDENAANTLWRGLLALPYGEAQPVADSLRQQIGLQQRAAADAAQKSQNAVAEQLKAEKEATAKKQADPKPEEKK